MNPQAFLGCREIALNSDAAAKEANSMLPVSNLIID
jgi:hypothetical protein